MDVDGEGFCEEVCDVFVLGYPVDAELALADAVTEPVKAHVDGFGFGDFDSVVGEADGRCVVTE